MRNDNSLVFAPDAHPYGAKLRRMGGGVLAVCAGAAAGGSPFTDSPDYDFAAGQTGRVWFWSAPDSAADGSHLTREVTIPKGTALFLTIRDVEVSSLEEPPFFGATEEEQRAGAN